MNRYSMLETYRDHDSRRIRSQPAGRSTAIAEPAVAEFLDQFGGASFAGGAYRVSPLDATGHWTQRVLSAFPALQAAPSCFASDWSGRQFAIAGPAKHVIVLDICAGQIMDTDAGFEDFHQTRLVGDMETILRLPLYKSWIRGGGDIPGPSECIEFTVPLFLGGAMDLSNLQLTDMEVSWELGSQLLAQARELPLGTVIDDVSIQERGSTRKAHPENI